MSENNHFIRSRGRISGPYTIDALQKMVARRSLSRFDELSSDRKNWYRADSFKELFISETDNTSSSPPVPAQETSATQPPTNKTSNRYYYSQRGVQIGPIDGSILQSLAASGTIGRNDIVWYENSNAAVQASQIPLLANVFTASSQNDQNSELYDNDANSPVIIKQLSDSRKSTGMLLAVCSAIIFILINAPMGPGKSNLIFWWNPDINNGTVIAYGSFLTIISITIFVLGLCCRNIGRSITAISLVSICLLATLIQLLSSGASISWSAISSGWLSTASLAIICLAICRYRKIAGAYKAAMPSIAFSTVLMLMSLVLAAGSIISINEDINVPLPGWIRFLEIFLFVQGGLGVASGIINIISANTKRITSLNVAHLLLIFTSAAAIINITVMITGIGSTTNLLLEIGGGINESRNLERNIITAWLIFLLIRVALIVGSLILILGTSTLELFTSRDLALRNTNPN